MKTIEELYNSDEVAREVGLRLAALLKLDLSGSESGLVGSVDTARGPKNPVGLVRSLLEEMELVGW